MQNNSNNKNHFCGDPKIPMQPDGVGGGVDGGEGSGLGGDHDLQEMRWV